MTELSAYSGHIKNQHRSNGAFTRLVDLLDETDLFSNKNFNYEDRRKEKKSFKLSRMKSF